MPSKTATCQLKSGRGSSAIRPPSLREVQGVACEALNSQGRAPKGSWKSLNLIIWSAPNLKRCAYKKPSILILQAPDYPPSNTQTCFYKPIFLLILFQAKSLSRSSFLNSGESFPKPDILAWPLCIESVYSNNNRALGMDSIDYYFLWPWTR